MGRARAAVGQDGQARRGGRLRARRDSPPRSSSTRAGHDVVVYERADRIGGLLRYGIPEFKMEKRHLDRRIAQMEAEGTDVPHRRERRCQRAGRRARPRTTPSCSPAARRRGATCRSPAASWPASIRRWSTCRGRTRCRKATCRDTPISAAGKNVVIIGGGDTGADCLGTAIRHGAASIHQFEILARPPDERPDANPWPTWPMIFRVVVRARGGRRARLLGQHRVLPRRRRRQRPGAARPRGRAGGREVPEDRRNRLRAAVRARPARHGLRRTGARRPARTARRRDQRAGQRRPRRPFRHQPSTRSSSAATWAAARASSSGPSPKDGRVPPAVDEWLMGETALPAPIAPDARPLT